MIRTILAFVLMSTTPVKAQVIEDFSGTPASRWDFFSDQVMGGVSDGQAAVTTEGLRLTGTVSTANNGGFIQARLKINGLPDDTKAIGVSVKGNGNRYYVFARKRGTLAPWRFFKAGFTATGGWQDITLPLSSFTPEGGQRGSLSPGQVSSIAVVAYGDDYTADVSVRRIWAE